MIFGVFFLAFFSHFVRAESAKNLQESDGLSLPKVSDSSKNPVDLCTLSTVTGNCTEKNPFYGEDKTQKLVKSNSEIQKAWRKCADISVHPCSKDSKAYQTVKTSLKQYPDLVYLVDSDGRNLLINAVRWNNEEVIALLVPYCANAQLLDVQDIYGHSALFTAIQNRNKYATALLLLYDARTDIPNLEGFDAVQFSCTLENLEMFYFIKGTLEKLDELKMQKKKNQT
jgi:ankyrin repeat protein